MDRLVRVEALATLQFDPAAVEVKAVYRPLGGALTKENCHWNYAADGKAYGLVALHIMSKQIPNWTWATWEWSGNTPDLRPEQLRPNSAIRKIQGNLLSGRFCLGDIQSAAEKAIGELPKFSGFASLITISPLDWAIGLDLKHRTFLVSNRNGGLPEVLRRLPS